MSAPDAQIRVSQNGYVFIGGEAALLGQDAVTLDSYAGPTPTFLGFTDLPEITVNEGTQGIEGVGAYRDVDIVPGGRTVTASVSMRLASSNLFPYFLRGDQTIGTVRSKCLPEAAIFTGSTGRCDPNDALFHEIRHALGNTLSFQAQEGQPLSLNAQFMAIADNNNGSAVIGATVDTGIGTVSKTLTWQNFDWSVGGTSYRKYLQSVSVQISNQCRPQGARLDFSDNPISRTCYQVIPGNEKITVSYTLRDLPPFIKANGAALFGTVVLRAQNTAQVAQLTINNNMLGSKSMRGVQPGQPFSFSADSVSNFVTFQTT